LVASPTAPASPSSAGPRQELATDRRTPLVPR
jgi:hypothetical protein